MDNDFCSLKEACARLAISRTSLYRLAWAGALPMYRVGSRATRVRRADIERILAGATRLPLDRRPHSAAAPADAA